MENILKREKYKNLNIKLNTKLKLPDNFPICYENKNLTQAIDSILFSLNNQRHVIIVGEEGSGITQIARWSAEIFSKTINSGEKNKKMHEPYLCICSKYLQYEDLIGITIPNFQETSKMIQVKMIQ